MSRKTEHARRGTRVVFGGVKNRDAGHARAIAPTTRAFARRARSEARVREIASRGVRFARRRRWIRDARFARRFPGASSVEEVAIARVRDARDRVLAYHDGALGGRVVHLLQLADDLTDGVDRGGAVEGVQVELEVLHGLGEAEGVEAGVTGEDPSRYAGGSGLDSHPFHSVRLGPMLPWRLVPAGARAPSWRAPSWRAPSWRAPSCRRRVDVEGGDSGHGYRRVCVNDRRKRCASRITLQIENRVDQWETAVAVEVGKAFSTFADLAVLPTGALASKFRVARVSGRSLHTIRRERHPASALATVLPVAAPRAPPRAARLGRLLARPAARSAPRRPTPSTRASPCSSTATGSSSRPVRDDRLSTLDLCARRGHARRPPHSVSHYARTARAIARDAAPVARDAKPPSLGAVAI